MQLSIGPELESQSGIGLEVSNFLIISKPFTRSLPRAVSASFAAGVRI